MRNVQLVVVAVLAFLVPLVVPLPAMFLGLFTSAIQAERDRIIGEYRDLLASDEDREAFDQKLGLAGVVFPYVENHNFYVEHWSHSILWRKMRELGAVFVKEGFFATPDDVFYLEIDELRQIIAGSQTSELASRPSFSARRR